MNVNPRAADDEQLPLALQDALEDSFEYAVGLRDGTVFVFSYAKRAGDWLRLHGVNRDDSSTDLLLDRGVDVRVSDVVWAASAPNGS